MEDEFEFAEKVPPCFDHVVLPLLSLIILPSSHDLFFIYYLDLGETQSIMWLPVYCFSFLIIEILPRISNFHNQMCYNY